MKRIHVAISLGDPAGIGPEVLAKAIPMLSRVKDAAFFIVGDSCVFERFGLKKRENIFLIDLKNINPKRFKPGTPDFQTARASVEYLEKAVSLIKEKRAQCLVTGPISKESVCGAGFLWPGHTEFLADSFKVKDVEMVFTSDHLKVVLVTRHSSLKDAIKAVSKKRIIGCSKLIFNLLRRNFCIRHPRIAVCGLNPHAGEAGLFGREEIMEITPAIKYLNNLYGKHFYGPYAPDTVFHRAWLGEFDMVIAMVHDQGLVPFKMVEFESGVHLTAGLPFIRTSPVHGTAFDIVGKNMADHRSMANAIKLAYVLTK